MTRIEISITDCHTEEVCLHLEFTVPDDQQHLIEPVIETAIEARKQIKPGCSE